MRHELQEECAQRIRFEISHSVLHEIQISSFVRRNSKQESRSDSRDLRSELHRYREWKYKSGSRTSAVVDPAAYKAVQYIKGKSSRKLQQEYAQLKKKYWGQHMWSRGYFSVTTGSINEQDVQRYIEKQEIHHKVDDFKISEF